MLLATLLYKLKQLGPYLVYSISLYEEWGKSSEDRLEIDTKRVHGKGNLIKVVSLPTRVYPKNFFPALKHTFMISKHIQNLKKT